MSETYKDNYQQSQEQTLPTLSFSTITKKEYERGRELENMTEQQLQIIADAVCSEFGVVQVPISFEGRQPHKHDGKRLKRWKMGVHQRTNFENSRIRIYKYTAVRQKQYAPKSAISTLLHELCHYFDYRVCGLRKSIHSAGFYKRIGQLKDMLSC